MYVIDYCLSSLKQLPFFIGIIRGPTPMAQKGTRFIK
jgi:hypothetical protein